MFNAGNISSSGLRLKVKRNAVGTTTWRHLMNIYIFILKLQKQNNANDKSNNRNTVAKTWEYSG